MRLRNIDMLLILRRFENRFLPQLTEEQFSYTLTLTITIGAAVERRLRTRLLLWMRDRRAPLWNP